MNTSEHPVRISPEHRTIQPQVPDDEDFYGVALGSNGTAAELRRRLAESVASATFPGPWTWCRCSGRPATAVTLIGSGEEPGDVQAVTLDRWVTR